MPVRVRCRDRKRAARGEAAPAAAAKPAQLRVTTTTADQPGQTDRQIYVGGDNLSTSRMRADSNRFQDRKEKARDSMQ